MRFYFFLICCLALLPATTARGEQAASIQIESDRMESVGGENAILFSGQVVARQGDLVVHSDGMTVFYLDEEERAQLPAGDERRLKKLFAIGNVKIETPEWIGTGERLDYFEVERKVYLTGNARVWQGNNLVTGEAVTIYLDEGKSIVERSDKPGGRVRAFFYSGDNNGPPSGPTTPQGQAAPPGEELRELPGERRLPGPTVPVPATPAAPTVPLVPEPVPAGEQPRP